MDDVRLKNVPEEEQLKRMTKVSEILNNRSTAKETVTTPFTLTGDAAAMLNVVRATFSPEYSEEEIIRKVFEKGLKIIEKQFYLSYIEASKDLR